MPDWGFVILKSFILITTLFFITKWLRKRQLAQLTIFDFISCIVLGGIVAIHTSTMSSTFSSGIIAMASWFIIPLVADFLSLKSKAFRDFVQGKSTILIQNAKIIEHNLKKEGFTADD